MRLVIVWVSGDGKIRVGLIGWVEVKEGLRYVEV